MALRKPSSYFGDDKKPEVNNSHQRESTPLSFAGTFDGIIESVYLKIKDLTDEQIEFIKDDVFKIYSLVDNLVEHELPNYKKQSMGATIQLDRKISDVKESLAIQLQEHIAETRSTIQTSLLENGLKKYDKTISALSTDLKVVERFISENAKDIVSLKEEVTKELEKATVSIPLIEERLREIKESYEGLTSKQLLTEGGLNEPPNVNNEDPLTPLDQNFVTFEQLQKHYQLFINRIQQQMATIGGGGETQLKYLDDIVGIATNASAYDGKFLRYNHGLKKFVFEDAIPQANETQALHSVLGYGNSSTRGMTVGVSTFSNAVIVGGATTELVVNGDARITGILTIGTASVTIDGVNNVVTASSYNGSGAALTGITTGQIVDFVGFATEGFVVDMDVAIIDYVDNYVIPGLSTVYATQQSTVGLITSGSLVGYATEGYVVAGDISIVNYLDTEIAGLSTVYTTESYVDNSLVGYATEGYAVAGDLSIISYIDNYAIPGLSTVYATQESLVGLVTSGVVSGYATEGYVDTAVAGIVSSAPTTLDTLQELAQALGDDPNFATTTANLIGTKASLNGDTFTGVVTATAFSGDGADITGISTANITGFAGHATESYVDNAVSGVSTFSGDYNDLSNKPTIPSDTGDLTNNAGFVTSGIVVGYATEGYVTNALVGYATEGYVDTSIAGLSTVYSPAVTVSGSITEASNASNGTGYTIGDQLTLVKSHLTPGSPGSGAIIEVTSVTGAGGVDGFDILDGGQDYGTTDPANSNDYWEARGGTGNDNFRIKINSVGPKVITVETYVGSALVGYATEGYVDSAVSGVSTFSGDYNDLSNKPTIPADTGDLTNNVGFVTSGVVDGYATETYVDNAVSGVSTFSGDYNDLSNKPIIPSDVGELTNNVGFVTSGVVDGYATETYVDNAVSGISTDNVRTSTLDVSGVSTFTSDLEVYRTSGGFRNIKFYDDSSNQQGAISQAASRLEVEGTNELALSSNLDVHIVDRAWRTERAIFRNNGAVELYYPGPVTTVGVPGTGVKRFETTAGGVSIDGGVQESFTTLTSSTGTVTHDCSAAQLFYHTSPSANFTVNLTNLALSQEYATTVTIVINQGDPAYMVTGLQIGGSAQTIKWQGNNSAPNGTASGIDVVTFSILNDGGTYVVLAQSVPFGGV